MRHVKVVGDAPPWAMRLIKQTLCEADVDDSSSPITKVTVQWEERPRWLQSDGLTYNTPDDRIVIHAGG